MKARPGKNASETIGDALEATFDFWMPQFFSAAVWLALCSTATPLAVAAQSTATGVQTPSSKPLACVLTTNAFQSTVLQHTQRILARDMRAAYIPFTSLLQMGEETRVKRNCSVIIGPGFTDFVDASSTASANVFSSQTTARSISIGTHVPVLDFGTVISELSDKDEHPLYNRIIPSDLSSVVKAVAKQFQWDRIGIVQMEGSVDFVTGVGGGSGAADGTNSRTGATPTTEGDGGSADGAVGIAASITVRSNFLSELNKFFASLQTDLSFTPIFVIAPFHQKITITVQGLFEKYRLHTHKTLVFLNYLMDCEPGMPGTMCLSPHLKREAELQEVFSHQNIFLSASFRKDEEQGVTGGSPSSSFGTSTGATLNSILVDPYYSYLMSLDWQRQKFAIALSVDAITHIAKVLEFAGDFSPTALLQQIRVVESEAFSGGSIRLTNAGERENGAGCSWSLSNVRSQHAEKIGTFTQARNSTAGVLAMTTSATKEIHWPDGSTSTFTAGTLASSDSSSAGSDGGRSSPTPWVGPAVGSAPNSKIGFEVVATLIAFMFVATTALMWALSRVFFRQKQAQVTIQSNRLQGVGTGYFLFASIAHYRSLQHVFPLKAGQFVETFNTLVESLAAKHGVCIVKFVENKLLLVACPHSLSILRFATELQHDLFSYDWKAISPTLSVFYEKQEAKTRKRSVHAAASLGSEGNQKLFNGLRVQVGIAGGEFFEARDAAGKVDYLGDAVNVAARLCAAAAGGQILCTARVMSTVPPSLVAMLGASDFIGQYFLSGLRYPVDVCHVLGKSLAGRQFRSLGEQSDAKLVVQDTAEEDEILAEAGGAGGGRSARGGGGGYGTTPIPFLSAGGEVGGSGGNTRNIRTTDGMGSSTEGEFHNNSNSSGSGGNAQCVVKVITNKKFTSAGASTASTGTSEDSWARNSMQSAVFEQVADD